MSNKRNALLTNAAFCAVLLFCLLGVGAGAYLLLFPGTTTSSGTQTADAPSTTTQVTEIIQPVTVPEIPEITAPVSAETTPAEPIPTEPISTDPEPTESEPAETIQPEMPEAKPVSAPPAPPVKESVATEQDTAVPAPSMLLPLEGEIVAAFSMDTLVYNATLEDWRTHDGVDISAEAGTGVLAAGDGTVADVQEDSLLGTTVVLQHSDGYRTTYAGLAPELSVTFGQRVEAGQLIGAVGFSAAGEAFFGPHLHFSVSKDGIPMDPMEYLAS